MFEDFSGYYNTYSISNTYAVENEYIIASLH